MSAPAGSREYGATTTDDAFEPNPGTASFTGPRPQSGRGGTARADRRHVPRRGAAGIPARHGRAPRRAFAGPPRCERGRRMDAPPAPRCPAASEAAPPTNETCTAPLPGASLPGATDLSQPRTSTQETGFENLAQQAARCARRRWCRSTRLKTSGHMGTGDCPGGADDPLGQRRRSKTTTGRGAAPHPWYPPVRSGWRNPAPIPTRSTCPPTAPT